MPDATTAETRWRCAACGNLTRFDVVRLLRLREYVHADLSGDPVVEESATLEEKVEHVTCRWCGAVDQVELVPRPAANTDDSAPGRDVEGPEPDVTAISTADPPVSTSPADALSTDGRASSTGDPVTPPSVAPAFTDSGP